MASTAARLRAERARRARAARARARERRRLARCRRRARKAGRSAASCRKQPTKPAPTTPNPSIGKQPTPTAPPVATPSPSVPGPSAPSPAQPVAPPATPVGPGVPAPTTPTTPTTPSTPTTGPWGAVRFERAQATRLLWRAGFGPRGDDVDRLLDLGLQGAIDWLVDPPAAALTGPEPHDQEGRPLDPKGAWSHDQLWWLDRMVRGNQPLVERMTLVWHDWFASSRLKVGESRQMLRQNATMRAGAFGSFPDLLEQITQDPAMLVYLDGQDNRKDAINENYGREVMELFTLGANRDAYSERDVREIARAFTGLGYRWSAADDQDLPAFFPERADTGTKTIFGQTGRFDWKDACRLIVENPKHESFLVAKLWSSFVPTPPDAATQAELQRIYVQGGRQIGPVLRAILSHPDLHHGQAMVKPPAVLVAGMLRAKNRGIDTTHWGWVMDLCGQVLFSPPNVAGWDDTRWMNSSTWRGRFTACTVAIEPFAISPWPQNGEDPYPAGETAAEAVEAALAFWGNPPVSDDVRATLLNHAREAVLTDTARSYPSPGRALRQNGLRLLVGTSSDAQTS